MKHKYQLINFWRKSILYTERKEQFGRFVGNMHHFTNFIGTVI